MNKFLEKWQKDRKFKIKIKLTMYTLFVILVSIYAISIEKRPSPTIENEENINENEENSEIIKLADNYQYDIKIKIDNQEFHYSYTKEDNKIFITKKVNDTTENYIYENNNYYVLTGNDYLMTTDSDIYDQVNKDYLNIDKINKYLSISKKENNQYSVKLKDIILDNDSDDYFVITINKNKISIDYTPLVNHFNNQVKNYIVDITINEGLIESEDNKGQNERKK